MANFNEYLAYKDNGEYSTKQLKIMDKIELSEDSISKIKSINKEINILVVAQVFCPDCRAVVPFFEKFSRLNNKIKITYSSRDESQDILKEKTGVAKIPTVFYNDGKELHTMLIEFPNVVVDAINTNPDNYDDVKYNFRIGKFNSEIEKELVNYLLSL